MSNQNQHFVYLKIDNNEKLKEAFDLLHDASMNESDIIYNSSEGKLMIVASREFVEDKAAISIKQFFLVTKYNLPLVKCCLVLKGVSEFKMLSNDSSLNRHTFNEAIIDGQKIILKFCEVLTVEFTLATSHSAGYLKDIEFIPGKSRSVYKIGFGKKIA